MTELVLPPITTYLSSVSLSAIPKLVVIVSVSYYVLWHVVKLYVMVIATIYT